ncbi:MurR/RpiR family transcriptional regulator [Vibrio methylphosphonaticus]|uniref:MurR/RpiR family transcriptional regulator n=1 Tax=Vibrio methylphosphonaticus TaxID=2946866 RepID=UPI00202A6BC5|nr:MurR/RpiR family transcriptional regulator [Vibrio methylphosphonaticus]MCL9775662.1 MurR/RpiR family transcriptional regulator [Vibrio methylphosphonaticus]
MNNFKPNNQSQLESIFERLISNEAKSYTRKEQRIVDYYLSNDAHVDLSGKEIANALQIHPSTLVRLAQKLGFKGHPELKHYLRKKNQLFEDASKRHQHTKNQIDGNVLQATIEQEIEHLKLMTTALTQTQLDQPCQLIISASKVFVNGQDNVEGFADHFSRRLMRSGFDANTVSLNHSKFAERFAQSSEGDVLILLFNNSLSDQTKSLITIARNLKLTIIAITDLGSATLPKDIQLLRIYRGEHKGTKSVSPSLVITNAMIRNLTALAPERTMQGLQKFESIRTTVDSLYR